MTADDARELEKTKGAEMKSAENGLIYQIQTAVKYAIRHRLPFLLWNLPDFVTGSPEYDPDDMLDTLAQHLNEHKFGCVADHRNLTLFITWKSTRQSQQQPPPQSSDRKGVQAAQAAQTITRAPVKRKAPEPEPVVSIISPPPTDADGNRKRHPETHFNLKNSKSPHWSKLKFSDDDL